MNTRVLVTGATGFVGRAVVAQLLRSGRPVTAARRGPVPTAARESVSALHTVQVGELAPATDWAAALDGVGAIVHCAARVHVMRETSDNPIAVFRHVNVDGTLQLARQASAAGVRRLVFISSIGVNGAETFGTPFTPDDVPAPHSAYARSKYEAEQGLHALTRETGIEVVIIRPPLVFGPDAPGNFDRLLRALSRGIPLPLGAVRNRRSLVALDNLVHLIATCIEHPKAANHTFMVSDGEDISTTDLLRRLARALGRPARLLPIPSVALRAIATTLGRSDLAQRLFGSLQVEISETRRVLGWAPVVTLDDALAQAAQHFVSGPSR